MLNLGVILKVKAADKPFSEDFFKEYPTIIEGIDAYEVLCPVSKLTGCRDNPLSLLQSLVDDPVKSRQLERVLAEIPSSAVTPAGVDDDTIIGTCASVLCTGTPAENDMWMERLSLIFDNLNRPAVNSDSVKPVVKSAEQITDEV